MYIKCWLKAKWQVHIIRMYICMRCIYLVFVYSSASSRLVSRISPSCDGIFKYFVATFSRLPHKLAKINSQNASCPGYTLNGISISFGFSYPIFRIYLPIYFTLLLPAPVEIAIRFKCACPCRPLPRRTARHLPQR